MTETKCRSCESGECLGKDCSYYFSQYQTEYAREKDALKVLEDFCHGRVCGDTCPVYEQCLSCLDDLTLLSFASRLRHLLDKAELVQR